MTDIVKKEADLEAAKQKEIAEHRIKLKIEYDAFMAAKQVYDEYKICFFRDAQPRYFYKLYTEKTDQDGRKLTMQEIKYCPHSQLYPNFPSLKSDKAREFLRQMTEGKKISIQDSEGTVTDHYFERREYDKMSNTRMQVDDITYNLVDISHKLEPTDGPDECPTLLKALMYAVTGNTITWNAQTNTWDCDKQDTLDWFEKWIYGAVHANIGEWSTSMPIIFGGGKVGKNALFEIVFEQLLGKWCIFASTWDTFNSNFDAFKVGKVFTFIDEIPDRNEWDKLKNQTGSTTQYIKEKYGPEYEVENCIMYALGSNQVNYPLPLEKGEQMMRVSPIRTNKNNTFAIYSVRMLDQEHGAGYCDNLIKAAGNDPAKMSEHDKGDYILRYLDTSWKTREAAQQFLNYLHRRFGGGKYQLSPLRSTDWNLIYQFKRDTVEETAKFILEHRPAIITAREVYEIYMAFQTIAGEEKISKKKANLLREVEEYLKEQGYDVRINANIAGDARETVFYLPQLVKHGDVKKYVISNEKYVKLQTLHGKSVPELIYPSAQIAKSNQIQSKKDIFG